MSTEAIEQIRRFNRTVSRRIGALEESYLARGRPLGEARLIFEIGVGEGCDLADLRGRLGLDSGYLSRLLRSLEAQGVVLVAKSTADGRGRRATLTAKGRRERQRYDALSDELAASMLAPLRSVQRGRLVAAMAEVERLLTAGSIVVGEEAAGSRDAKWCLAQYYGELDRRFEGGFDPGAGAAGKEDAATRFLVARLDGEPVACGMLKPLETGCGEIKRVWTAPAMRGMGVASRLMDRLEAMAGEMGYATVRLDTNKALVEAHDLYLRRGYRDIARYNDNPYAHRWFEKQLDPGR